MGDEQATHNHALCRLEALFATCTIAYRIADAGEILIEGPNIGIDYMGTSQYPLVVDGPAWGLTISNLSWHIQFRRSNQGRVQIARPTR